MNEYLMIGSVLFAIPWLITRRRVIKNPDRLPKLLRATLAAMAVCGFAILTSGLFASMFLRRFI